MDGLFIKTGTFQLCFADSDFDPASNQRFFLPAFYIAADSRIPALQEFHPAALPLLPRQFDNFGITAFPTDFGRFYAGCLYFKCRGSS